MQFSFASPRYALGFLLVAAFWTGAADADCTPSRIRSGDTVTCEGISDFVRTSRSDVIIDINIGASITVIDGDLGTDAAIRLTGDEYLINNHGTLVGPENGITVYGRNAIINNWGEIRGLNQYGLGLGSFPSGATTTGLLVTNWETGHIIADTGVAGESGVRSQEPLTLVNHGTITGHDAVDVSNSAHHSAIENYGTLAAVSRGVMAWSGLEGITVTNFATGTILAETGIRFRSNLGSAADNHGLIDVTDLGVNVDRSTMNTVVTNHATGIIRSGGDGVELGEDGASGNTLMNIGSIEAASEGVIVGGDGERVENSGSINGASAGVAFYDGVGSTLVNTGQINSARTGVGLFAVASAATIDNSGAISGGEIGLEIGDQAGLTDAWNRIGGTIAGDESGFSSLGSNTNLLNLGGITGTMAGAEFLGRNAALENAGTIIGDNHGVLRGVNVQASLVNSGIVRGRDNGVTVVDGASDTTITNLPGGTIEGGTFAVQGGDGNEFVKNAGTLQGNVSLGAGDDIFRHDGPNANFTGGVDGGENYDEFQFAGEVDAGFLTRVAAFEKFRVLDDASVSLTRNWDAGQKLVELGSNAVLNVAVGSEFKLPFFGSLDPNLRGAGAFSPDFGPGVVPISRVINRGMMELGFASIESIMLDNDDGGTITVSNVATLSNVRFRTGFSATVIQRDAIELAGTESAIENFGRYEQHGDLWFDSGESDPAQARFAIANSGHWFINAEGDLFVGALEADKRSPDFVNNDNGKLIATGGTPTLDTVNFDNEGEIIVNGDTSLRISTFSFSNAGKLLVKSGGSLTVELGSSTSVPFDLGGTFGPEFILAEGHLAIQRGASLKFTELDHHEDHFLPFLLEIGADATLHLGGGDGKTPPVLQDESSLFGGYAFVNEGLLIADGIELEIAANGDGPPGRKVAVHNHNGVLELRNNAAVTILATDDSGGSVQGWIDGGTIRGIGTINGSVINTENAKPGSSPGTLVINGDYIQTADGSLEIEIGGLLPGDEHDQLIITGEATFEPGARVDIRFLAGTSIAAGTTLDFFNAGLINGNIDDMVVNVFGITDAGAVEINLDGHGIGLTTLADITAVPLPAPLALLLAGLVSVVSLGTRYRDGAAKSA